MSLSNAEPPSLVVSITEDGIAILEMNRPKKRNALSQALIDELTAALRQIDRNPTVFAAILTSSGPFCAGADLTELAKLTTAEATRLGWLKDLNDAFSSFRKPILAAVRGFALGGGFELALMVGYSRAFHQSPLVVAIIKQLPTPWIACLGAGANVMQCDMVYAAADAKFGFPEITLGTIPGAGGTQRLTKTIGKQKAMELILTGATSSATEMQSLGVVNKAVSEEEDVLEVATTMARTIASFSAPAIGLAKQAVLAAETTTLPAGLEIERALYYSSFSLEDCREGVAAFKEKRKASVQHR